MIKTSVRLESKMIIRTHFRTNFEIVFFRKVNKSYRGRSCPMIVHCSDGVGRAGTYVLIDMVLNRMMKGSKEIDIAATLEHIRDQRAGQSTRTGQVERDMSFVTFA